MFGIRWGWLFPVLFVKAANIRVMAAGPSAELLGLPQPPFASQAFQFFGMPSNLLHRPACPCSKEGFYDYLIISQKQNDTTPRTMQNTHRAAPHLGDF